MSSTITETRAEAITDPEVLAFIAKTESLYPPVAVELTVAEQRARYDRMAAAFRRPRPAGIAVEDSTIDGPGGPAPVRRYRPAAAGRAMVVYFHGGGFVLGGLESHDDACAEIAVATSAEVVSVDYRLCPEHPHPAAYRDALAAIDALADRPLVVAGDSAGGNLAAAVALARPQKIAGQVLIYPGLGGEALGLPSYMERANAPMLTTADVTSYKRIRADGTPPADDPTFAPLVAESVAGLPPCFVSIAEHDPLRDDGAAWVERLRAAGVAAELAIEAELPHGHLRARSMSRRAAEAFARICEATRRLAADA